MNNVFIDFISKDTRYKHISETQFKSVHGKRMIDLCRGMENDKIRNDNIDKVWEYDYSTSDDGMTADGKGYRLNMYFLTKTAYCGESTADELYGKYHNIFDISIYDITSENTSYKKLIFGIRSVSDYDYVYSLCVTGHTDDEIINMAGEIVRFTESHDTLNSDDFVEFVNDKFKNAARL